MKKTEHKNWQVVVNFREDPAKPGNNWPELPVEVQTAFLANLETVVPPPSKCRFGRPAQDEPLASALFIDIQGNTSLDAQIRADNLIKQCLDALGELPLVLESCGVRLQEQP